jgi:hypothetical protein
MTYGLMDKLKIPQTLRAYSISIFGQATNKPCAILLNGGGGRKLIPPPFDKEHEAERGISCVGAKINYSWTAI